MKKIVTMLVTFALFFVSASAIHAADVVSGDSIQDAIDNASSDETITVHTGEYDESLVINGIDLNLVADGEVVLRPTTACGGHGDVIQIYSSTSKVEGFEIDVNYDKSRCLGGIYARGMAEFSETDTHLIAVNNYVHKYGKNGITVNGELATAEIEDNVVTGRGHLLNGDYAQNGIQLGWYAQGNIKGNTVSGHYWDGCTQPGKNSCTPWVATGVLFYLSNANLGNASRLINDNNLFDNQHNLLQVLEGGPFGTQVHLYK